jgi:hypothetical protein
MSSDTISPSIDQAALLNFKESFYELAQQSKSRLVNEGAISMMDPNGKSNNMSRIGRLELAEVDSRNPDKQYSDYALDNRQFSKRRFTRTVTIDALYDINELISDPTSPILSMLDAGKERVIDRVAVEAAVGDVLVGAPDTTPSSVTAANDGVSTVDGSAGVTYSVIQQVTENFINNDVEMTDYMGSCIAYTGSENTDLMNEDKFINSDYISGRPVDEGYQKQVGMYKTIMYAGSVTGGITVTSPVLPEGATLRKNVVLAPNSIAMSMKIGRVEVERSNRKVNSFDITIDLWINAMRTEGVLVQIITSTI